MSTPPVHLVDEYGVGAKLGVWASDKVFMILESLITPSSSSSALANGLQVPTAQRATRHSLWVMQKLGPGFLAF